MGSSIPGTPLRGRQVDDKQSVAFRKLCDFLEENNECQYTLDGLITIMSTLKPSVTPYCDRHMKRKLKAEYGKSIIITEVSGKSGVSCLTGCMNSILTDKWYSDRKQDIVEEENRVIQTAAMLIRRDIRSCAYDCDAFPSAEQIASGGGELVPRTLNR